MGAAALTALLAVALALLLWPGLWPGVARAHEDTTPLPVGTAATDAVVEPQAVSSAIEATAAFTTTPLNNGDANSNRGLFRGRSLSTNIEEGFYRVQLRKRLVGGEWSDSFPHTVGDTTAPVITVHNPSQTTPARSRAFSATDGDPPDETRWYRLITDDAADCTDTPPASPDLYTYTEGDEIIFSSEGDNGKYVCFWSTDRSTDNNGGPNTAKAVSDRVTGIDTTPASLTVTNPDQTRPAQSRNLEVTQTGGVPRFLVWKKQTAATCDADYPADGAAYTSLGVTLTAETDNGKYVCFWIKDNEGAEPNITAAVSQQVQGIDLTVPTITVTNPTQASPGASRTFSATVTDPTPSGLTDADNPVTFQYQKITPASTGDAAMCDDAVPSGAVAYTSGDDIMFSDEADNNKWVCFWATDAAGNVGKANTDKVADLDTEAPTIAVTMVELQPTAVETRARLVKATTTDASTVSMWYEIQTGTLCAASPFQADGTTLREGVSVYAGSYDANTDTFTPDRAVVVRENNKRVCFWAQDGTTPPNVVSGVSGLTSGVVGPENHAITVVNPAQTSVAKTRTFSATDNFLGRSEWNWKLVASTGDCATTLGDMTDYTEDEGIKLDAEASNGKYVCFVVADDNVADDNTPDPHILAKASARVAGIDRTPPAITVTNPNQESPGVSRTFSATYSDTPEPPTGVTNTITMMSRTVTPVQPAGSPSCPDDPHTGGAVPYTSGDDIMFSDEADNNKWVCFWATDAAGNVGKANTDKVADLDTEPPTITVTMVELQPTAVETRARLVKATTTDASTVSMWYEIQTGTQCAASPFQDDGSTLRQGVSVYAGSYDANTDTFTPDRAVVVRENDKRVCFWAQDGTTPPNVVSGVSGLTSGVVGPENHAITVVNPAQTSVAKTRTFSATDNFRGSSEWDWKLVASTGDCTTTLGDMTDYTEDGGIKLDAEASNGKYVCFVVADDNVADDNTPDPHILAKASARVAGIDRTPPAITVTNPNQESPGTSRTFSATYSDTPEPPTGVTNTITMVRRTVTPVQPAGSPSCPDDPHTGGAVPYTSGDDIVFSDEGDNNKWVCFWATDGAGNVGKANTDKIANLDTRAPVIGIGFQTYDFSTSTLLDTTRQGQTRNRLVKAMATDASEVSLWYKIQSSSSCSALDTGDSDTRVYAGSYSNTLFTGDSPVVVTGDGYVCFWARDSATPPNIVKKASSRITNVVGAPTITISGPGSQESDARSRTVGARDDFTGDSVWGWKLVKSATECVASISDLTPYTEGQSIVFRSNDDNTNLVCFAVKDDSYPDRVTTVAVSAALARIQATPIEIEVTNPPSQAISAVERVFSAVAATGDRARATNWRWKIVDAADVDTSADFPCGATLPSGTRPYTPGTDVTVTRSADNGKYVCFWTSDRIGNVGNASSVPIQDIRAPAVSITAVDMDIADDDPDIGTIQRVSATDDVTDRTNMRYKLLDAAADCAAPCPAAPGATGRAQSSTWTTRP